jgi:hypothetical protein
MNERMRLIPASSFEWRSWLDFVEHDYFHTPECHALALQNGEGEPWLAVYGTQSRYLAWPYLLRPIDSTLCDVGSVYGYSGPLLAGCDPGDVFVDRAWAALLDLWRVQRVVSAFTRFHPILRNHKILDHSTLAPGPFAPSSGLRYRGKTVSIDLSQPSDAVWRSYSRNLRRNIQHAQAAGVTVRFDLEWAYFEDFFRHYVSTMDRNHAREFYYFSQESFHRLREVLGDSAFLAVAERAGRCISAAIFLQHRGILTAFLGGTEPEFLELSPISLIYHEAKSRARLNGWRELHLGGGRGAREDDSLFRYKAGFSPCHYPFYTGQWILDDEAYSALSSERQAAAAARRSSIDPAYFPMYRAPLGGQEDASPEFSVH